MFAMWFSELTAIALKVSSMSQSKTRVKFDADLTPDSLRELVKKFKNVVKIETGRSFPKIRKTS
jgi:hypothetical protein